jgi:3-methyl-2-oxobutanoate hydroxymethyltransferase
LARKFCANISACRPDHSGQLSRVLSNKITSRDIQAMKGRQGIAALTAYDYPTTKLMDEAGVPFIHVGDSVGMVVLGYPNTTLVTMADMEHHVRAVARAQPRALVAADLPYQSYETPESAVANARRLIDAGAQAVKAEGGQAILAQVEAIVAAGIPYCGHIGMLPQHVLEEGGYRVKGRTPAQREALLADAQALARAGAFSVVLEVITPALAREITRSIPIPTIGIGSGPDCDGQILVVHDLLGLFPWFTPGFVKPRLALAEQIRTALSEWSQEVARQVVHE